MRPKRARSPTACAAPARSAKPGVLRAPGWTRWSNFSRLCPMPPARHWRSRAGSPRATWTCCPTRKNSPTTRRLPPPSPPRLPSWRRCPMIRKRVSKARPLPSSTWRGARRCRLPTSRRCARCWVCQSTTFCWRVWRARCAVISRRRATIPRALKCAALCRSICARAVPSTNSAITSASLRWCCQSASKTPSCVCMTSSAAWMN